MFTSIIAATLDSTQLAKTINPLVELCKNMRVPFLTVIGAVGALWCIILGVKYAKSEDPQEHEKSKKALKNAIIGFVLIFVLMIALSIALPLFQDWMLSY